MTDNQEGMNTDEHGKVQSVDFDTYSKQVQMRQQAEERANKTIGELEDIKKKLSVFEGIDLEDLQAKAKKFDEGRIESAAGNQDEINNLLEETRRKERDAAATEIEKITGQVQQLSAENRELKVVDKAMSVLGSHFNDDMHGFIKAYVRESVDVDESGDFVVRDENGKMRYNSQQRPMTLDDFAQEIAEKHPSAAKSQQFAGAKQTGERTSNGAGADIPAEKWWNMTEEERARAIPDPAARKKKTVAVTMSAKFGS